MMSNSVKILNTSDPIVRILTLAYLDVMGEHGEVHAAPGGEAEAGHGVDSLVAPDPEPAPAPQLSPPTPGLSDQVEAGDGDQAGHQQLGQPEVGSGAVMDVEPARHVQVRPAHQKKGLWVIRADL